MGKIKALLDTNIMIDFLNRRKPFYEQARLLMIAGRVGEFDLWISSSQMTDLIYILSEGGKPSLIPKTRERIQGLRTFVSVFAVSEREIDKIRGVDTLVINALRKEPHLSHFTLDEALRISRAVSSNVTYLTHVSHQMGRHAEEQAALPEGVYFAYDGLTVEIPE